MDEPTRGRTLAFWLLLGLVSTAFAEVLSGSQPFVLVSSSVFLVVPIYLLHAVVLAGVVFATDRVSYASLYLAGVLFGLYEAYVTKVVWTPTWEPIPISVLDVYVFETLGLVLFWHPIVAFVIPLVVVETVATDSDRTLVGPFADHPYVSYLALGAAVYLALLQGALGADPIATLLSNVATLSVLFALLFAWRRTGGHEFTMASLLPSGRSLAAVALALVALYLGYGALLRPEALPRRPGSHLPVLAIYAVVGGLLLATLRRRPEPVPATAPVEFTWLRALGAGCSFVVASFIVGALLGPFRIPVLLSYYLVGLAVGAVSLTYVVTTLRR